MQGFGWSFYGFFLFCFVWIAGYFAWARWMAARERLRPERGGGAAAPSESERGWGPASVKKSGPDSNP